MSIHLFVRWLTFLFILGILNACGGGGTGSDGNRSSLLGEKTTTTTPTTTTTTPTTVYIGLEGQTVIPNPQTRTTLTIISYLTQDGSSIAADIPFAATVSGSARLEGVPATTDYQGRAILTVVDDVNENVVLTITGQGSFKGTISFPLYFGANVSAEITTKGLIPADGTTGTNLQVIARDYRGAPISSVGVMLTFPGDSFAVATETQGVTDTGGNFNTQITDKVAQTTSVIPVVGGYKANSLSLKFGTTTVTSPPNELELIVKATNVAPDGSTKAILVVVARDAAGTPIPNVPVSLTSDSATAVLNVGSTNAALFITGNTGEKGSFELNITDTVEEDVSITASSSGSNGESVSATNSVKFQKPEAASQPGVAVGSITLDQAINNSQPANGTDKVSIRGKVFDTTGKPLAGKEVSIIVSGGSAKITLVDNGKTDASGRFFATLTDDVVEQFTVSAIIGNVSSNFIVAAFTSVPPAAGEETPVYDYPESITLLASPEKQTLGSDTTLTVIVRDKNQTPMSGVTVNIAATGATARTAIFDFGQQETDKGGTATFKVKNSVVGQFTITATASIKDKNSKVVGTPISDFKSVEFFTADIDIANLTVTVVNDNQPASGESANAIKLGVVAQDSGGRVVPKVPLVVIMDTGTAVAVPTHGTTDENGYFTTSISSTVAGTVTVHVAVEGTDFVAPPRQITFIAQSGVTPKTVELQVVNSPQPADDSSKITLIAIPRDAKGSPIKDVDIQLISDSNNVKDMTGKTNVLGEYRTTVSSKVPETFHITPVAGGIVGTPVEVVFTTIEIPIPTTLTLNATNNNQEVGQNVDLVILARDGNGIPMAKVPVVLIVSPGSTPPDITGSTTFGSEGFRGLTSDSGIFQTTVTNSQTGSFKVKATVESTQLASNTVDVIFKGTSGSATQIKEIKLLAEPAFLGSITGISTDPKVPEKGVTVTAVVKDINNNLVKGAAVNFSANSGEIRPTVPQGTTGGTAGITNDAGRAEAFLTSIGNPNNRDIKVTASIITSSGETKTAEIIIAVTGTEITVTGEDTVILGSTPTFSILLKDSAGNGISGQMMTIVSALGNPLDTTNPVTNAAGQARVIMTASVPGQDTLTVSKEGATSGTFTVRISDDNFTLESSPDAGVREIALNTPQEFIVHWDKGGEPQANQQVQLSATRGNLPGDVLTDFNGDARFTIQAADTGRAVIVATAAVQNGPSKQVDIEFIATQPASVILQANPSTIGVNEAGKEETEQSEIIAIVRDPQNNLVKGKRVNFTLQDITGGRLFPSSAITDSNGRASTIYTSGTSPSASNGVTITARVSDAPSVTNSISLTVGRKSLFIKIGTSNKLVSEEPRYKIPYTVLVTDANGAPVSNATINLSIYPVVYVKGDTSTSTPGGGDPEKFAVCLNEDANRNGILDVDEDTNKNGRLDPGNVLTFDVPVLTTDATGFKDFFVVYAKQYANVLSADITARAVVSGSESIATSEVVTSCLKEDCGDAPKTNPPNNPNPFGIVLDCTSPF